MKKIAVYSYIPPSDLSTLIYDFYFLESLRDRDLSPRREDLNLEDFYLTTLTTVVDALKQVFLEYMPSVAGRIASKIDLNLYLNKISPSAIIQFADSIGVSEQDIMDVITLAAHDGIDETKYDMYGPILDALLPLNQEFNKNNAWNAIYKSLIDLQNSNSLNSDILLLDYIMDLEHNSGLFLDYMQGHYDESDWHARMKGTLDDKAKFTSLEEFLPYISPSLASFATKVIYNLTGRTEEMRTASILDYQQPQLSPEIWDNNTLNPEVKMFVNTCLYNFFYHLQLKGYDHWLLESLLASSLATYFYTPTSDFDIKLFIDLVLFIEYNPTFAVKTDLEILDWLKDESRKVYWTTQKIPNTLHPLDLYFLSAKDLEHLNLLRYDSLYVMSKDEWVKKPKKLVPWITPVSILDIAKEKAEPYLNKITEDFSQAKEDCIDFLVLQDFLKTLPYDDLYNLKVEYSNQLDIINNDIEQIIHDENAIKILRKMEFNKDYLTTELEKLMGSLNYSDGNLVFKLIQRYGYLKILVEITHYFEEKSLKPNDVERLLSLLGNISERAI